MDPTEPREDNCEPVIPDYSVMSSSDLLTTLGDDGSMWAAAFCQIAKTHGHDIDEGWMGTWFANAIEHSWDVRTRRAQPPTKPVTTLKLVK